MMFHSYLFQKKPTIKLRRKSNMCGECALKILKGGMCPIFNKHMDDFQSCPQFTTELKICDICGSIILNNVIVQEDPENTFHLLCQNCASGNPCQTCANLNQCSFRTDTNCKEQPYIQMRQRQGNMIIQRQAINPKRIEETCAKGCPCFDPQAANDSLPCQKENKCGCRNHHYNWNA